jgi:hypothetical protein
MIKCKLAIFLGAGFSKEADLPIMSEFGKYSVSQLDSMKRKHGPGSNSPRDAAPLLISNGELFEVFRKYLIDHTPTNLNSFSADNMEDLFTIAEMMYECGMDEIELDRQKKSTMEILLAIKLWLWKIYQRIPIHDPSRYNINIEPYETFISTIHEYGLHNVSIITTNYDMILEYLFHQKGIQVCYPISEELFEFNDLCGAPNVRIAAGLSCLGEISPALCKLHGSINYFIDKNSTNKKLQIVADTAQRPIGKSKIKDKNAPSIMAVDAIYELTENRNLVPEIIPPTYAKFQDSEWLREIWRHAAESLITAHKWIFIGYSFPSSDGFMKSLINLSLMHRKQGFPEIVVVDPDTSGNNRINYACVFDENSFLFEKMKFSEVINSGRFRELIVY